MPEKTWRDATKREKLDLVCEALKPHERDAIRERVRKHFETHSMADPNDVFNVVLREAWREEHGEVESWDRAARAAGVKVDASPEGSK